MNAPDQPITGPAPERTETAGGLALAELQAEAIGWTALANGAYLHTNSDCPEIVITGTATAAMADLNVLWLV